MNITELLQRLYDLLEKTDTMKAEETLGFIAQAKAIWEEDASSVDD